MLNLLGFEPGLQVLNVAGLRLSELNDGLRVMGARASSMAL